MKLLQAVFATLTLTAVMAQAQMPSTPSAAASTVTSATDKKAALANDTAQIKSACGTELAAAPACASETVGHGMIMCLNKNVGKNISAGCRTAMKAAHSQMESMKH